MASPDDDVISRAKAGDPDAWRDLYRDHAGRLLVWLRSLPSGDSAHGPDDIAAEAWLTAASRIQEFSGSEHGFGGWLFGIARNHAFNARRRTSRRKTWPTDVDDTMTPPEQGADAQISHEDYVRRLLATLPRREAEVVACMDVVGLDTAATATALDMTATAVRVTRHRALTRLRRTLPEASQDPARNSSASR